MVLEDVALVGFDSVGNEDQAPLTHIDSDRLGIGARREEAQGSDVKGFGVHIGFL